jgi:RimJ/RimL family protein N-acetyltransferase
VRVQLKTDVRNATSRAAITKLGAQMEGIHRKHRLLPNGTWRDSVYFSILDTEWKAVRCGLEARLAD